MHALYTYILLIPQHCTIKQGKKYYNIVFTKSPHGSFLHTITGSSYAVIRKVLLIPYECVSKITVSKCFCFAPFSKILRAIFYPLRLCTKTHPPSSTVRSIS